MEGATCEIVENGRLAVERFRQAAEDEFDAILMDVQMPAQSARWPQALCASFGGSQSRLIPSLTAPADSLRPGPLAAPVLLLI